MGDTIAFGKIPRHDLENSSAPELFEALMHLRNLDLPADTKVFFGHGEYTTYGDMLKNFDCLNKTLTMRIETQDGKNTPIEDFYFEDGALMISLQEITKFLGTSYFFSDEKKSAVTSLPNMSKLKVKAGNLETTPDIIELSYSDHEPLGNMRTKFLNDVLFPAIEREANGHVKIIPHWNGELSISYQALPTVQEAKSAQIAVVVPEHFMDALTLHQLFKSFPVGPAGQEQVNFFRSIYEKIPALKNEVEKQNLHVIFIATGFPAAFFSHEPLTNLRSIKGQKWRSASFWHKDFLQNARAVPITMAWSCLPNCYEQRCVEQTV